ncbi:MAG: T9SS C-terminal target domain-containing protein, partial [Chitinophagia bacterium]|nr:T9SS C-terminal target domain-containing protein [Chitinophagia bacterium]
DTGTSYQLYRNGVLYGTPATGTGSSISFTASSDTGTYTVVANTTAGCSNNMLGTASIIDRSTSITLGATPLVCLPTTTAFMSYTGAIGTPITYNINWDTTALAAGYHNVVSGLLGTGIFDIPLDTTVADTFYATMTVNNGYCTSVPYNIHVATYAQPTATMTTADTTICAGRSATISVTGPAGTDFRYRVNGGALVTATIPTGGVYSLATSAITSTTTYTLFDARNPACSNTINDTIVINPVSMQWIGGTTGAEHDWNTATNWLCGSVPTSVDAVTIPVTTYYPAIGSAATGTTGSLTVAGSAYIMIGAAGSLNVTGTLANSGKIYGEGKVVLNGSTAQVIQGAGKVKIFELDNANGATIDASSSLTIDSILIVTNGTLTTNDSLVINADTINTARVAPIGTGGAIAGKARVMQSIQGGFRRYRFWSHPFDTTIPYSQLQRYIDITGAGGAANGFRPTPTNSPSAFRYSTFDGNSTLSYDPGWKAVTSALATAADSNQIHRYEGVRVFMRGSKGEGFGYGPYYPHATVAGQFGRLNQGRQVIRLKKGTGTGQDYNLLGNPYASPIDLGTIAFNAKASGNIIGSFYVWDPSIGAGGAFTTYPISTVTAIPYYIQANTSFEVRAANNGDSLVINETDKFDTATSVLLRTTPEYTNLYIYDEAYHPWDLLRVKFDEATGDDQDKVNDADKLIGGDLNFYSMSSDNKRQAIDVRPYNKDKVIPLGIVSNYAQKFIIKAQDVVLPEGGQLYLHDKMLGQYVELTQGAEYHFEITKDAASQGNNRFELAMKPAATAFSGLEVLMTPNPATDDVTLAYRSGNANEVNVRVMDVNGVAVYNKNLGVQQNGTVRVPLAKFAAGMYMVELTSGDKKVVQRLVKE